MRPARFLLAACLLALAAASLRADPTVPLHGSFTEVRRVRGIDEPFVSAGLFVLLPGRGLVWRVLQPLASSVVLTPSGVFRLDPSGKAHRLAGGGAALDLMDRALEGDLAALGGAFTVRRGADAHGWILDLTPKTPAMRRVLRSAKIGGTGPYASWARMDEPSGDETEVRFSGVAPGSAPLTPSEGALLGP